MTRSNPNALTPSEQTSLSYVQKMQAFLHEKYPGLVDALYAGVINGITDFDPNVRVTPDNKFLATVRLVPKNYLRNDIDKAWFNENHADYAKYFIHQLLVDYGWRNVEVHQLEFVGRDTQGNRVEPLKYSELTNSGFKRAETVSTYSDAVVMIVSVSPNRE